ncbi:hypothetical protein MK280_00305 [Myxococcota bacterium]|nr:hypothetical protein [Myxococcota bacterium]
MRDAATRRVPFEAKADFLAGDRGSFTNHDVVFEPAGNAISHVPVIARISSGSVKVIIERELVGGMSLFSLYRTWRRM